MDVAAPSATGTRVRSLDAARGFAVAAVVFFEYLPPSDELSWLRHSPWLGVRAADFVFPVFLFVVGAGMALGRPRPGRLVRRTISLVLLGLLYNSFGGSGADLATLRVTGVLQTIAVAGLIGGLIVRLVQDVRIVALAATALLAAHGIVLSLRPMEPGRQIGWAIDRAAFGSDHLYLRGLAGHDPEGLLTVCLGGTALVLVGWLVGTQVRNFRAGLMVRALAAMALATGVAWLAWEPSKRLWTPTFTLLTALVATVLLVAAAVLVDRRHRTGPVSWTFIALGRNAIVVYVGQHLVLEMLEHTSSRGTPLRDAWLAHLGTGPWALLAFASIAVVGWTVIAAALHAADWHVAV